MKIVISETPPYYLDLDAPSLPAFPAAVDGIEQWGVWCKHCRSWHWQGAGEGHRYAHCDRPGSPYEAAGYNISKPNMSLAVLYDFIQSLPEHDCGPALDWLDTIEFEYGAG